MRIGIDVDGVLADFNTSFIERVVAVTGEDKFPPRPFDIPTWNYPEHYGYSRQQTSDVWDSIKSDPLFWRLLEPYDTTLAVFEALDLLRLKGNDVYFITARPGYDAKGQTERWLKGYGIGLPTVLLSSQKGLCARALELERYIDDRIENVIDTSLALITPRTATKTYLMTRPWNVDFGAERHAITRVTSVLEMLQ